MIKINGKTYEGDAVSIKNGQVTIDNKVVQEHETKITIEVLGNIKTLAADHCSKIDIYGSCGSVNTVSGDIKCKNIEGNVNTVSGDIDAIKISGSINTVSGDVNEQGSEEDFEDHANQIKHDQKP